MKTTIALQRPAVAAELGGENLPKSGSEAMATASKCWSKPEGLSAPLEFYVNAQCRDLDSETWRSIVVIFNQIASSKSPELIGNAVAVVSKLLEVRKDLNPHLKGDLVAYLTKLPEDGEINFYRNDKTVESLIGVVSVLSQLIPSDGVRSECLPPTEETRLAGQIILKVVDAVVAQAPIGIDIKCKLALALSNCLEARCYDQNSRLLAGERVIKFAESADKSNSSTLTQLIACALAISKVIEAKAFSSKIDSISAVDRFILRVAALAVDALPKMTIDPTEVSDVALALSRAMKYRFVNDSNLTAASNYLLTLANSTCKVFPSRIKSVVPNTSAHRSKCALSLIDAIDADAFSPELKPIAGECILKLAGAVLHINDWQTNAENMSHAAYALYLAVKCHCITDIERKGLVGKRIYGLTEKVRSEFRSKSRRIGATANALRAVTGAVVLGCITEEQRLKNIGAFAIELCDLCSPVAAEHLVEAIKINSALTKALSRCFDSDQSSKAKLWIFKFAKTFRNNLDKPLYVSENTPPIAAKIADTLVTGIEMSCFNASERQVAGGIISDLAASVYKKLPGRRTCYVAPLARLLSRAIKEGQCLENPIEAALLVLEMSDWIVGRNFSGRMDLGNCAMALSNTIVGCQSRRELISNATKTLLLCLKLLGDLNPNPRFVTGYLSAIDAVAKVCEVQGFFQNGTVLSDLAKARTSIEQFAPSQALTAVT